MVQGIENLTLIAGKILSRRPHSSLDGFDMVTIEIDRTEPVPGEVDLLEQFMNRQIDVAVRRELLGNAAAGNRLRCRAKRTPDGAMCEKVPAEGDFAVE